ncbi:MAG: pseudouridine-5'-phosphate glycosidase [Acholeplasmatales bacterium]|jgi:pseudouridine-5'-phosphate glycosidase|nr:pseudouridine-5'-phosphate glycosidase [Acholeplasmatales bacterium]
MIASHLRISPLVQNALLHHLPVVALETTIISHGMPYPDNIATALEVERIIKENGAIPATIGIIDGEIVVGLSSQEIKEFGSLKKEIIKVSRRDFAFVISQKKWGSLTVAATMIVAKMVGIDIFVTGGIGGVHYGVSDSLDISADLEELAHNRTCVVCAGAKAILDLAKTLEYLETKGVDVIGYQSDYLAAFYSHHSDLKLEYRLDSPGEIAKYLKVKKDLALDSGTLISNPIPLEFELPYEIVHKSIQQALDKAQELHIKGKVLTPFLLKEITKLTDGLSLEANKHLIYHNALIGSLIAVALNNLIYNTSA